MRDAPDDAMAITAIGRMWEWEFDYGNGMKSKELVVPVNKPIRVNLKSEDVNHSLFIPAFRVKQDAIPGYSNYLWFVPTMVGDYEILCTEYCGLLHSSMLSKARVLEQDRYDIWFSEFKNSARGPEPDGYLLLRNTGCIACHSLDGTKLVGPSFKNLFGKETTVVAGTSQKSVTVDEEYIINSIYNPDSEIVIGFSKGLMQSYKNVLKEEDIQIIIDYLKTLAGEK
jgi:cytochrome c oxidase subunit 2